MAAGVEREACLCPEEKSPQTRGRGSVKAVYCWSDRVDELRFSYGADPPGRAFGSLRTSNNNFLKKYHAVHTSLICQSRGPALPYYIQPVLKFHLFVWSQRRKSISLLLILDLEFLESTPKTLINSLHATARNFDTPSYWTLT